MIFILSALAKGYNVFAQAKTDINSDYAELNKLLDRRNQPKELAAQQTFFRHPPCTVVLRRKHTGTLYVITNAQTPGSLGATYVPNQPPI